MGKRWSKLQSRLYNLMDEKAEFQIHCALYEMNSMMGIMEINCRGIL